MSRDHRDSYRNASKQAMKSSLENFKPKVVNASDPSSMRREAVESVLPDGANLSPKTALGSGFYGGFNGSSVGGGGNALFHAQRPYLPEYETPDRYYFPKNRLEANRYWRMFFRDDPLFGTAVEMYSQMMFSDFDIVFENESDKGIRNLLEDMCTGVEILNGLQNMVKEFLVIGEAFPHLFFNKEKGVWSHLDFLNPDLIEVVDAPLIDMDPILHFVPSDEHVKLFSDTSKEAREIQKKFPPEFLSKIRSKQKLHLSNKNVSYISRKLHMYDNRGTSLATRLWRIWMIEDAVANSTIAMFRRASSPLKVAKLGDPSMNYIPQPEEMNRVAEMLAQCELDPQSWFLYHYAINFETIGNQDRTVTYSREFDTIEKIKLIALGMSKSFVSGDASFANAKSGLQVFLRRLLSFRQFFENMWIYPKFLDPIIKVNDFHKPVPSEVRHRYRIRGRQDQQENYIRPKIIWRNNLDPKVDSDLLQAYGQLKNSGFVISDTTFGNAVGLDPIEEVKKKADEFLEKEKVLKDTLGDHYYHQFKQETSQTAQKPPGSAGSGAKPVGGPGGSPTGNGAISAPPGSNAGGGSSLGDDSPLGDSVDRGINPDLGSM
jgi:hypothetical protein